MNEFQIIGVALGLAVGLILSLTGAGGAILSVPLLVFFLHMNIAQAAPIALLAIMLAASTGAILGLRAGIVRYKAASLIAISGMLLSPLGIWSAQRLSNIVLTMFFAIVLMIVAIRMLHQASHALKKPELMEIENLTPCKLDGSIGKLVWNVPCARALLFSGALAGFLSGLLGVGGGFIIVPALKKYTNLSIQSIVATSLAAIALVSASGLAAFVIHQRIEYALAFPFAGGALVGMAMGRWFGQQLPAQRIQQAFALLACLVSIGLLIKVFNSLQGHL
jgi:uncharacterized membrane protein YfcA